MINNNNTCSSNLQDRNRLLSLAAMFQESFSIDWLLELTGYSASQILTILETGANAGWLERTEPGVYKFINHDKQNSYLSTLDPEEKNDLHQRIAQLFANAFPNEDQMVQAVARHLIQTSNNIEQCRILMRAGDLYLKSFQTEEALQCYLKTVEDLAGVVGQEADDLFIKAALKCSNISSLGRHTTKRVIIILQEALERADKTHRQVDTALLNLHLFQNEYFIGHEKKALCFFKEGWSTAQEIDNPKLMRSAVSFRIFYFFWQGLYKRIIQEYEKYVPDIERFPGGRFSLITTSIVGYCYGLCGQTTQGMGLLDAIESYCRERGDLAVSTHCKANIGLIVLDVGRTEEAIDILEPALEEAIRISAKWVKRYVMPFLALAHYLNNNHKRSIALLNKSKEELAHFKTDVGVPDIIMKLCWGMEQGKLPSIFDLSLEEVIRHCIRVGRSALSKGVAYRYKAYLQRRDELSTKTIIRSLKQSEKFLIESGHQNELIRTRLDLTRQYLLNGQEELAQKAMDQVSKSLTPMNDGLIPGELKPLIQKRPESEHLLKEILRLGQETVTIRDNKQLIQHIISMVNRITGAERGAIFLLDETSKPVNIELKGSKGLTAEEVKDSSFTQSMRLIRKVAADGKGRVESAGAGQSKGASIGKTIRSRICVPLVFRDNVAGVLYHDNRILASAFKDADLELLAYFAAQAAIALNNSEAFEKMKQHNLQLTEEKQYYEEELLHNQHFADIIGESKAIQKIISQIDQVADSDATVLILGETGVGKELVASAIHAHSPRKDKPFIRVQCSALPDSLIPSELFGHEKGAFTGAIRRKIGRFELANGGTLLLDEIGDLSPDVQVRFLRVLQTKEFERIGGDETIRSDFRLITATNRNLAKAVDDGDFRPDLYYRLNVFPIFVPPLRDRPEDIPMLSYYFLKIYSDKMGKTFEGIGNNDVNRLHKYDWPGNIRELENVIERGVILSRSPTYRVPPLADEERMRPAGMEFTSLAENERLHILSALEQTSWKVAGPGGAAELLKVKPTTLDFKMKKLGITRPKHRNKSRKKIKVMSAS